MGELIGADPESLDRLAANFNNTAKDFGSTQKNLSGPIHSSPWNGRKADQFRQRWDSEYARNLRNATQFLNEQANELRRQAEQQRRTSGASSISPGRGVQTGGFFDDLIRWIMEVIDRLLKWWHSPHNKPLYANDSGQPDPSGGISPSDIVQGKFYDCWLLATLGALASTPDGRRLIQSRIEDLGGGRYRFTFADGKTAIADLSSVDERSVSTGEDIWPLVVEEAFMARYGSESTAMNVGHFPVEAMKDLGMTGGQERPIGSLSGSDFAAALRSDAAVLWIKTGPGSAHALSVVGVTDNTVTIRNPWGTNDGMSFAKDFASQDGVVTMTHDQARKYFFKISTASIP
jgi:hypothetical protein